MKIFGKIKQISEGEFVVLDLGLTFKVKSKTDSYIFKVLKAHEKYSKSIYLLVRDSDQELLAVHT